MYKLLVVLALVAVAQCEVVENIVCNKGRDSRNILSEVSEIRVTPCPEAENGEPCGLFRGTNATVEVDFTPSRSSRRMKNGMFWVSKVELPFRGINQNACRYMTCPLRPNVLTTYSATLSLGRNLPAGTYPLKLKLYDGTKIFVCQLFTIKLQDPPEEGA